MPVWKSGGSSGGRAPFSSPVRQAWAADVNNEDASGNSDDFAPVVPDMTIRSEDMVGVAAGGAGSALAGPRRKVRNFKGFGQLLRRYSKTRSFFGSESVRAFTVEDLGEDDGGDISSMRAFDDYTRRDDLAGILEEVLAEIERGARMEV